MKSLVRVVALERVRSPLLAIAIGQLSSPKVPSSLSRLDREAKGELARLLASGDFTGALDETSLIYPTKGPRRVLLVGLGVMTEITRGAIRRAAAVAGRAALKLGTESMTFHLAHKTLDGVPPAAVGQVIIEGVAQGAWSFNDLKATEDRKELGAITIVATREDRREIEAGRRVGAAIALGHYLARNLQALPGNVCTPQYLADTARRLGTSYGYKVTVLGRTQMQKQGMGGMIAVSQGSRQEPQFIVLEYKGAGRQAPLCFVGKGVTFDSGGISIKPALHMEDMKYDMSGAAAVLGLFETLAHLKPAANVVGIIPATENMPSGTAIKPGDIVTSHYGKSIEIVNNRNGYQDDDEAGVAGVRVVTARGLAATTDTYGRYHFTCAIVPNESRGSNFVLKLDDRTLPSGFRSSTRPVQVQRATRGKALRINFGASIHRVVGLDIADAVFEPDSVEMRSQWQPRIGLLVQELQKGPAVLRLSYVADVESEALVDRRLASIKDQVMAAWIELNCCYELVIEPEVHWRLGAPPARPRGTDK